MQHLLGHWVLVDSVMPATSTIMAAFKNGGVDCTKMLQLMMLHIQMNLAQ